MEKRSSISLSTFLKGFQVLAPHPWVVTKLVSLQLAKIFFPFPNRNTKEGQAGRIHQLSIRLTQLCNLRCHTCGQWGDNGFMHGKDLQEQKKTEVSTERYIELLEDLVHHGHKPNVYLWGGEPTMYSDLDAIISSATKLRLPTSIATNGHLLSKFAENYVKHPLFLLQVSIDGHDARTHNSARPAAGEGDSFNDITIGLQAVRHAKRKAQSTLPVVASLTVISQNNVNHLVDIYNNFKDYVDVFIFYLSWWIDEENADLHDIDFENRFGFCPEIHRSWIGGWRPGDYQLLSSQLERLREMAKKKSNPAITMIPDLSSANDLEQYYTNHSNGFGFNQCISIFQAAEITSNGDLSPCRDYYDFIVGNVKDSSVTELWNSPKYKNFRKSIRKDGLMPVCRRCCGLMGY